MKNKLFWVIIAAVTFVLMLWINGVSNTGWINDTNMKMVSDQFQNLFTPAGYAFSIWGLIYLGLALFLGYVITKRVQNKPSFVDDNTLKLFTLINVVNTVWIVLWLHYEPGYSLLLMLALLGLLIAILIRQKMCLEDSKLSSFIFLQWPFSLYLGWIIAATIANAAAFLTDLGWTGGSFGETTWTIVVIIVAVGIYMFMIIKRNTRLLGLVGVWALVAVASRNFEANDWVANAAVAGAVIIGLTTAVHGFLNREKTPFRKEKMS